MAIQVNDDVRTRLDAHLDAVERALVAAGSSRERRRGVVDDLEAQILDMLAAQTQVPAVGDLEGVLARLDPPAAYGETAAAAPVAAEVVPAMVAGLPPQKSRYSRTAIWGFISILLSLVPLPLFLAMYFWMHSSSVGDPPHTSQPIFQQPVPLTPAPAVHIESQIPAEQGAMAANVAYMVPPGAAQFGTKRPTIAAVGLDGMIFSVVPCFGVFGLLGTVLGWVAFGQIRLSHGALRGTGLALFDGLFYPVIFGGLGVLVAPLTGLFFVALAALIFGIWYVTKRVPQQA